MTRSEICQNAINQIKQRNMQAQAHAEERKIEIYKKIPQIEELNKMLSQTSAELSKIIIRREKNYKESFEKIRKNNMECQQMIKQLLTANGYPADYLEVHYRCTECEDTGYIDGKMCGCLKRLINSINSAELNRSANMPDADFNHFSLEYYRGLTIDGVDCYSKMSDILSYCIKYAQTFSESSGSILMLGKTGVGKTHLSMAIAKKVTEQGSNVIYGSVINLLRAVESEHFGKSENNDTLGSLNSCDLLILDDLGAEHHTAFNESMLYNIINTRINMNLPTIISANLSMEELYGSYNERIISRISCCYNILLFAGKDIRQLKRYSG